MPLRSGGKGLHEPGEQQGEGLKTCGRADRAADATQRFGLRVSVVAESAECVFRVSPALWACSAQVSSFRVVPENE